MHCTLHVHYNQNLELWETMADSLTNCTHHFTFLNLVEQLFNHWFYANQHYSMESVSRPESSVGMAWSTQQDRISVAFVCLRDQNAPDALEFVPCID